jgi:hypothetical protein
MLTALQLGPNGASLLEFPEYLTWLTGWFGSLNVEQVKSWVRISAAVVMLVVLLRALWVHQDAPKMLQRVLARIEKLDRQQTARWNSLQTQLLHLLQSLRESPASMPADGLQQSDADVIAARRKQEQLILQEMWQQALVAGQAEVSAWNAVKTPESLFQGDLFPGSSGARPLAHSPVDSSTPFPHARMHAVGAVDLDDMTPQAGHAARGAARGVHNRPGLSSRSKATLNATQDMHLQKTQPTVAEPGPRNSARQQQTRSGDVEAEGSRMQLVRGSKTLNLKVGNSAGDALGKQVSEGDGGNSPRRSPRGARGAAKRVGEHDDAVNDEEVARREKKHKSAKRVVGAVHG